ncbi:MAG: hypothetical protein DRJ13_01145 [Bacteroidetes bacterium]|nr:MAG: hypothetical protein DRJ13_01145 [Bacteroidota bacterium]
MNKQGDNKLFRYLVGFYGILQAMHLFFLGRAGYILLKTGRVPFPASPPPGGWNPAVLPFMMGMAAADVVAASLGIFFSSSLLIKKSFKPLVGIISLTIALSSAIVYLAGTLPAGAWDHNPMSYLIVVLAFSPIVPLYFLLMCRATEKTEVP